MGLTPLQGLVMGTRSGDVDPGLHAFLAREAGLSIDEIDTVLNKRSGLLGLSGVNDFRELEQRVGSGRRDARLAFDVAVHRLKHYVGAYLAHPRRLDVLVFTAGVGENSIPCGPPSPRASRGSGSRSTRRATRPVPAGPRDLTRRGRGRRRRGADERGARHRPADRRPRRLTRTLPAGAGVSGTCAGTRGSCRREIGRRPVRRSTSPLTPSNSPAGSRCTSTPRRRPASPAHRRPLETHTPPRASRRGRHLPPGDLGDDGRHLGEAQRLRTGQVVGAPGV